MSQKSGAQVVEFAKEGTAWDRGTLFNANYEEYVESSEERIKNLIELFRPVPTHCPSVPSRNRCPVRPLRPNAGSGRLGHRDSLFRNLSVPNASRVYGREHALHTHPRNDVPNAD